MKPRHSYILIFAFIGFFCHSCLKGQTQQDKTNLTASEFSEKLSHTSSAQLIDVRSPKEFRSGHLADALNINWNSDDFMSKAGHLGPSKSVFVYCLSGSRSEEAAQKLRSSGFRDVYELDGGILKWRALGLPETPGAESAGMSMQDFEAFLLPGKTVMVSFYAEWCPPCRKMKPALDEIASNTKDNVVIVRINIDENQAICKELKIDAVPVTHIYKNNKLAWSAKGYMKKEDLEAQLK